MDWSGFQDWLSFTPLPLVALAVFGGMVLTAVVGAVLKRLHDGSAGPGKEGKNDGEGYVVSAVLALLALLLGFTFSLSVDRFDARRHLVLVEANAIGTTYLRAQMLPEPHRTRMSDLLVRYTDNRIALAEAKPVGSGPLLAASDQLGTDIWTATKAAFPAIQSMPFSSAFLETVNNLIDQDSARKAARSARVPPEVFAVLFVYMLTTGAVLGYVLHGRTARLASGFLLALLTLSLLLIIDIDRPTLGGVVESQGPMETLRRSLKAQPPQVFDRWTTAPTSP